MFPVAVVALVGDGMAVTSGDLVDVPCKFPGYNEKSPVPVIAVG